MTMFDLPLLFLADFHVAGRTLTMGNSRVDGVFSSVAVILLHTIVIVTTIGSHNNRY